METSHPRLAVDWQLATLLRPPLSYFDALILDQLHQPAFDRRQHRAELMAALHHLAVFGDQRPHSLAVAQIGAFLDPEFGALGGATECGEHRGGMAELDRVIAPMSRRDHAAVEIEDPGELEPFEADLAGPVPG